MTMKDQFKKIKENWLIAVLIVGVLLVSLFGSTGNVMQTFAGGYDKVGYAEAMPMMERAISYDGDFAPEVEERKITQSASLSSEVERGEFKEAEMKLKAIVKATDSYLLNENVNKYDRGMGSYYSGYYQLKVDTKKYDVIIGQLKEIGEIESFSENARDVTGRYTDLSGDLDAEKARLQRYQTMLNSATEINDKIQLTDKIYNLERRISYLEEALENIDQKVDYTTISVNLKEKQSEYADLFFIKFSQLVKNLVGSINSLLGLVFWAVPWVIVVVLGWFGYKRFKKRKK